MRDYLAWVRDQRCRLSYKVAAGPCLGRIEADHMGSRPLGRKADDRSACAMCSRHHADRHAHRGFFRGFNAALMRAWCDAQIEATRLIYESGVEIVFLDEVPF